jgi:hypothetical protein
MLTGIIKTLVVGTLFFSMLGTTLAQTEVPSPSDIENTGWTLVPPECLGDDAAGFEENADGTKGDPNCGFSEMMQLVANIMGLLFVLALAISTLLFAYAGFKYATALGNPSQIQGAKKIFTNVAIGLALVFGAYLIVTTIVAILDVKPEYNKFLENADPGT